VTPEAEILDELLGDLRDVAGGDVCYVHWCEETGAAGCPSCLRGEVRAVAYRAQVRLAKARLGVVAP